MPSHGRLRDFLLLAMTDFQMRPDICVFYILNKSTLSAKTRTANDNKGSIYLHGVGWMKGVLAPGSCDVDAAGGYFRAQPLPKEGCRDRSPVPTGPLLNCAGHSLIHNLAFLEKSSWR
jgi:hypothetical protein